MRNLKLAAVVAASLVSSAALAGTVVPGYTGGGTVPTCDDCATDAISPGFALNFFGNTYNQLYISNNGYVSFDGPHGNYSPQGLGSGYNGALGPIIAPFLADVDTRGADTVSYGTGLYNGINTFGITWSGVGYFGSHSDKLNTFQLLLSDRSDIAAGDFDIYFNYDAINWETGDFNGGSGGTGGNSAAAGFNAGTGNADGTYYQIPGSLVAGSLLDNGTNPLISQSNDGVAGQYLFQVRSGEVAVTPEVPEPATWAMFIGGFGLVGGAMHRKKAGVSIA